MVIEEYIENYKTQYEYYETISKIAARKLEDCFETSGIRAIVTFRAKNPRRLLEKIQNRNIDKQYIDFSDIDDDIVDLAGVRVALYFPNDLEHVEKIILSQFNVIKEKSFPETNKIEGKIFLGYKAKHFRVSLKNTDKINDRYIKAKLEIQVASVLMHAWSEVEHDLIYKKYQGEVSSEEKKILDELNGLVLAGELALERLKDAEKNRIERQKIISNKYQLSNILQGAYNKDLKSFNLLLGDMDSLYNKLSLSNLNAYDEVNKLIFNSNKIKLNKGSKSLANSLENSIDEMQKNKK